MTPPKFKYINHIIAAFVHMPLSVNHATNETGTIRAVRLVLVLLYFELLNGSKSTLNTLLTSNADVSKLKPPGADGTT